MNYTSISNTSVSCGSVPYFSLPIAERLSPELRAVLIFRIVTNAISCTFVILLNILVMVTVKNNRRLRTKSNVSLACLATTDLVVGLVVQPLQIVRYSLMLKGETDIICDWVDKIAGAITFRCVMASVNHFVLLSAERYLAIKHSFAYENLVTVASGLMWAAAIIPPIEDFWPANIRNVTKFTLLFMEFIFLALVVYFNVAVYKEVRRNERQIMTNQVSAEVKEKLLKNKKAFYCTVIVVLAIFLCYFPGYIIIGILISFMKHSISLNVKHIILNVASLFPILNSLFNPLIYAVRMRHFRVAFIQLLSKKTLTQAEQLERKVFGPRQIQVIATANGIQQGEAGMRH